MGNLIKTTFLLTFIGALFLGLGYLFGGQSGLTIALLMAVIFNFGSFWFSDRIVLAAHRARPIGPGDPSHVNEIVADLCLKANLPKPKIYVIPSEVPNAFATGRSARHSALAVTEGILRVLDERELRGVLAHELSHVRNHDILVGTIAATFAAAIMYFLRLLQWTMFLGGSRDREHQGGVNPLVMLLTVILAPIAAFLIQMAVSRTREFMADRSGADLSDDPQALAAALRRISRPAIGRGLRAAGDLETAEKPAMSHLYIVSHLSGQGLMQLFSTHPPVEERVRRLMEMRR